MSRLTPIVVLSLSCLAALGCGSSDSGPEQASRDDVANTDGPSQAVADGGIKTYAPADLAVPIGEFMPALEGGTLEIAPPQGWDFKRAGGDSLVAFVPKGSSINSLPRILLNVEDCPHADFPQVDADNIVPFTEQIKGTVPDNDSVASPPQPLILGENAFVRYVIYNRQANATVATQSLVTVNNGRMYTISLESYERQFQSFRDAGYAAGASMRFSAPAETAFAPTAEPREEPVSPPPEGSQGGNE